MEKETFPVRNPYHFGEAKKNVKIVSIEFLTEIRNLNVQLFSSVFHQNYHDQHFKYIPDILELYFSF